MTTLRECFKAQFTPISSQVARQYGDESAIVRLGNRLYGSKNPEAVLLFYQATYKATRCADCEAWFNGCEKAKRGLLGISFPVYGFIATHKGGIHEIIIRCDKHESTEREENPEERVRQVDMLHEMAGDMNATVKEGLGPGNRRIGKKGGDFS